MLLPIASASWRSRSRDRSSARQHTAHRGRAWRSCDVHKPGESQRRRALRLQAERAAGLATRQARLMQTNHHRTLQRAMTRHMPTVLRGRHRRVFRLVRASSAGSAKGNGLQAWLSAIGGRSHHGLPTSVHRTRYASMLKAASRCSYMRLPMSMSAFAALCASKLALQSSATLETASGPRAKWLLVIIASPHGRLGNGLPTRCRSMGKA